ncbi:uncharacterized protein LOC127716403 [Mytilus californianus]|uniref:uncharacterized protein LOC127716403 n=1 Tax=Mytilus californianus TaxID=6549 RepID=UPI0022467F32|nr:uncharacterized protein LOC127716403 [Mytilus californianus]XP_052078554.1 uncharacterized protein LOC127716403 [Mytilus californianus]XP_052078555.1 uncharacterized protein LOC127716403 [Mytilus californianus]
MEEDAEGLDRLIKQKKCRPKYARIISMEFSKNELHQTSDSRKKHRTGAHSNQMEVNPDEDSDGSEYYSAEEEFLFTSSSSSISTDDESVETGPLDQSSDSVFDSLQSSCSSNFSQADTPHLSSQIKTTQERQRAPSKKQKRKRKKSGNVTGFGYLPFCNIESFDIELSELREEIVDLETNIQKAVPSLVELSISASKRLAKTHSFINVPKSIKRILQIGNSSHSFRQLQLDYLFNVLEVSHINQDYDKETSVNLLPHRNIWCSGCGIDDSLFNDIVQGSKSSSYFLCCYDYQSWISVSRVHLNRYNRLKQISALAHTIDLMLPARLAGSKQIKRRHKSDTNCQSAEMEQNMKRIQQYIRNKCTSSRDSKEYDILFDDRVFDLVFPYVLWARGDLKQASQAFLKLVDSESKVRVKAMYLYDAGRMSLQFGDSDSAVRYFHLAKDALATKQKHNKEDLVAEIDRQTRMLCAASNDVGLLSYQKADRSLAAWMSAISVKLPDSIECAGPLSAFDAFLCYFGSYWHEKTGSLYDEAIKRLQTLAEKEKYLYYYLSMVYALQGKTDESFKMYRRFTANVLSKTPHAGLTSFRQNIKKPWQPLIDKVIDQGSPPTPMKVVWRTQLLPPKFSDPHKEHGHMYDKYPHEADRRSSDLNLRISVDGYLTGDLQMVLPPMRGIYLDLYTGNIHLTKIPSSTEAWRGYQTFDMCYNDTRLIQGTTSIVPTMTEVYRGPFGEIVHLIHTNMYGCVGTIPDDFTSNPNLCHLMWTGADGQKTKINVYHRLRWFRCENIQSKIKEFTSMNKEQKAEILRAMEKFINKGWSFDAPSFHPLTGDLTSSGDLEQYIKCNLQKKQKNKKQNDKKGRKKQVKTVNKPQRSFDVFSVIDVCVFDRGLVLALSYDDQHLLMILNTTTRELFMKPSFVHLTYKFVHFAKQTPMMMKRSDCFCIYSANSAGSTDGDFLTYDRHGEMINDRLRTKLLTDILQMDPITHESKVYSLTMSNMLLSSCNGVRNEADYLGEMFSMGSVADILVLLTTSGEVKFVDLPSLLPLSPILNKPLDSNFWEKDDLKVKDKIKFTTFKVVGEASFTDDIGKTFTRAAIAVDNLLLILMIHRETIDSDAVVTITQSITLAGFPKEIHFVNETVGFLLTVTQHFQTNHNYRENLYHYLHDGQLKQVLLCLGHGPRSFLTVYLPDNSGHDFSDSDHGKAGMRLYMRDGHGGIICVILQ